MAGGVAKGAIKWTGHDGPVDQEKELDLKSNGKSLNFSI